MALIKCKECSKEISDKAMSCSYCGCPNDYKNDIINKERINPKTNEYKQKIEDYEGLGFVGQIIIGFISMAFLMLITGKQSTESVKTITEIIFIIVLYPGFYITKSSNWANKISTVALFVGYIIAAYLKQA